MKTKYSHLAISAVAILQLLSSCNYLDVVPDERVKIEDAYSTPSRTEGYLYSCYGLMPCTRRNVSWTDILDRMTGGEITTYYKYDELGGVFTQGLYNPGNPSMSLNIWNTCLRGLRQCYEFLEILDIAKVYNEEDREYFRGEANFLIAYYHFKMLQTYGPTFIIDHKMDVNTPASEIPVRSPYDEVVDFIVKLLDEEAVPRLKEQQPSQYLGRATRSVALALKSRVLLYAASPLFNGNSEFYADFKDAEGNSLISQTYDVSKWQKAADAALEAITEAEKYHRLYQYADAGEPSTSKPGFSSGNPSTEAQRALRYCFMDTENLCEVIWGDARLDDIYDLQGRSEIRQTVNQPIHCTNSCAPTLQMVELFYTENGLPIDKDKLFPYEDRYQLQNLPANFDHNNYTDRPNDQTIKLHLNREPRFYAWIGFPNGNYEITRYNNVTCKTPQQAFVPGGLKMEANKAHGWKSGMNTHYSVTGYLNKKFTHPGFANGLVKYPFPVFRLAELYLNYAEALVEVGGEGNLATARSYINKVRNRAGIPSIEEAWQQYAKDEYKNEPYTQDGMRNIVRRERQVELYLENQRFWDLRRWKQAEVLDEHFLGWNIRGTNIVEFFNNGVPVPNAMLENHFSRSQYLMPIPLSEIQKCSQIVQNPYYE